MQERGLEGVGVEGEAARDQDDVQDEHGHVQQEEEAAEAVEGRRAEGNWMRVVSVLAIACVCVWGFAYGEAGDGERWRTVVDHAGDAACGLALISSVDWLAECGAARAELLTMAIVNHVQVKCLIRCLNPSRTSRPSRALISSHSPLALPAPFHRRRLLLLLPPLPSMSLRSNATSSIVGVRHSSLPDRARRLGSGAEDIARTTATRQCRYGASRRERALMRRAHC